MKMTDEHYPLTERFTPKDFQNAEKANKVDRAKFHRPSFKMSRPPLLAIVGTQTTILDEETQHPSAGNNGEETPSINSAERSACEVFMPEAVRY